MAQTTRFALFGPVLLVVALPEPLRSTVAPIFVVDKNELKKNTIRKKKKHVLMAQMTRIALFGPVLFVVTSCRYLHSFNVSVVAFRRLVYVKKSTEKKETLTNGPNDANPVLLVAAFPEPLRTFNVSIVTVNIV